MEILPGIHEVPGIAWSRMYLIEGDALTLVDSGMPWSARSLERYIRGIGRRPEELEHILVTHSHPDHTGGALSISRRTGARIVAHALDTKTHSNRDVSLSYMGAFASLRAPLPFLQRTLVTDVVNGGEVLPLSETVQVIHTPGHTPGSACYLLPKRRVLFTGDTLFSNGARLSRSVPFPGYDGEAYRESLRLLASLDFDVVCGGHGAPLMGAASDVLRRLLVDRPDPPSWRGLFASLPRRLFQRSPLTGEE